MNSQRADETTTDVRRPIAMDDRLLAEAVRALERDGAALHDEPGADAAGRAAGGDLERRIVTRAAALSVAPKLRGALRAVHGVCLWAVIAAAVLAAITGAGAARAALGTVSGDPVNFFWALASLLGIQSALLVAWFVVLLVSRRGGHVSPLGGAVLGMGRWVAGRLRRGPSHVAAVHAVAGTITRGAIGRWTLSSISHALWSAANIGCLVMLIVLLSTREYRFTWETTILSADAYERITRVLSVVPGAAGFPCPTTEQIASTEALAGAGNRNEAARAWSGLLIGSIVAYGLAPRLALLALCALAQRRALRRFRLDLSAPGHERLRDRLMPAAQTIGVIDGDGAAATPAPPRHSVSSPTTATGPPVIMGHEIDPPTSGWPPRFPGAAWRDLGLLDGRPDVRRAARELSALGEAPRITVIVCALTVTPDRGVLAALGEIATAARGPVGLLLTQGQTLRQRAGADGVERRVGDWRALAARAGIGDTRVIEIDLDHVTAASLERAAAALGLAEGAGTAPARRVEEAFALLRDRAARWGPSPRADEQAALHRDLVTLYRDRATALRSFLRLPAELSANAGEHLATSARRLADALPDRLRQSPKWLAAGAVSGALGCLAVGTLLAPAALAALPAWAMSGAGLAAMIQMARRVVPGTPGTGSDPSAGSDESTRADAVRAATLFALLLELQGRGETAISRVLDAALPEDLDAPLDTDAQISVWLDETRHRFDAALGREMRS